LRLPADGPPSLVTVAQQDEARSYFDAPSAAVSGDGRFVAFASYAPLVPADTNRGRDVYVLDRTDGTVSLESVTAGGRSVDCDSAHPGLSADGQLLVYQTGLACTTGAAPAGAIALRDRRRATVTFFGTDPEFATGHGWSHSPVISADGRFVAFVSSAITTRMADTNGPREDVYLFDVQTRRTRRVSVDGAGRQPPTGASITPSISADGRFVAFASAAPLHHSVVPGAPRSRPITHIYVRDTQLDKTRLVSVPSRDSAPNGASWRPSIDGSGRTVAFVSAATNLGYADQNGAPDVYMADLESGLIELVSRSAKDGCANGGSGSPAISADGRIVAFQSEASDLVCGRNCPRAGEDINLLWDIFLFDRRTRAVTRLSGEPAVAWMEPSVAPATDANGTVVTFSSRHPIDAGDTKNDFDLFIRTRAAGS